MSFARLLSSRSASLHSFVGRMFRSSLLHALVGAMAMCGGMSVLATMAQAQAVSATVAVGTTPFGVAVNSVTGMIYVINSGSNTVTAINGSNNSTATIAVGSSPYSVALNSATNMIYVVNNSANTVTAINGVDNSTSTINVGRSPEGVAVDAVHNMIYVANLQSSTVTAISGVDNSTSTIPVGSYPGWVGVNAVTNTIYVANTADNTVTVINGANNSTSTIAVGVAPRAVTVNVVTNTIYVANYSSKTVTAINGANNSTSTITVGTQPSALALNDVTNTVYVTNFSSGTVTIINGANNSTSTITVGTYPAALALNELTNTIYVANQGSNTVTVINGANSSTSALNVGLLPGSVAVNPATNIIYVGNNSANTATVINGPPMPSAVAVSCLPNPFSYGAGNSTTCTGTASGGATPTGTLTWTVNAGAPTTSTLSGGVATATELTSNAGGTYTVAAAYGGDTGHLTSSGSTTVTISKASPIPSISCTPNPITYGSQITTCTAAYGSGVTGTVAVTYNGNAWTWPVLSGGSSSQYGFNYQPAGSYAVAVNYSGDANNNAVSGLTTLTISKATGVFSVTSSANPVLPGASVTFTCTATAGGQPLVTGAYMAYWVDGALMENVPTTGGALQWTTSALTVGSHTIACTGGDANYNSAGVNYTEAVTGSTFSSLSSSVTPSSYGQAVKLSSLVSTGGSVPTGTVTFLNGASTIGTSTVASMSATNLIPDSNFQSGSTYWTVVGTEPMVAGVGGMLGGNGFVYTGTGSPAGWMGNTSSVVTVVPGATYTFSGFVDATAVTNGVAQWMIFNPSINTEYAEADMKAGSKGRIFSTFTVPAGVTQVVFITDTSNLTATNGGQVVWGEPQLELASQMGPYVKTGTTATAGYGGVATFTASTLPVGSDSITAVYGGDAADLASTTPSLVQVVNKATPTMSVTCALSVVTYSAGNGALTSCNAVLSAGTGSVTFNGQWTEGIAGGISTISGFEQQAAQVMPLVAVYSGDANYNTVTASTTLTINKATPSITWSTPDSITYGMALSGLQLNATASVAGTFAYLPPAGTVLSAGVQTLSVTFTPTDAVDYSSASGSVTLVVTQATPVATVTSSLNPAAYNAPITFTTVLGEAGNTSTGSVTFKDGATTLGVGTVSQVSTTNLLAWSENALAYGTDYTGSTIDASAVADPLGGSGTVEIDFPAGTNDRWMYAVPLSNTSGKTYIASVWMRAPTPTTIQFNVEEHGGNYTGSNPTVNVGTQWQRYQTTLAIPTSDPGSTAISVGFTNGAGNGATVIDVFGFQLEQSTAIGPYVKTTGTSISGTGALARYTTSSLSVGTHAINGVFGGDSVYPAATSASLQQVVNKVTPVLVLSSSQSPSPLGTSVTFTCTGTNGGQPVVSGTGLGFYVDTIYMGVQLVNGAGAATWSDAALNAGSHDIGCSASDSNYNGVGVDITQVVNKATPTITWATPAPIVYGATLSSTQLNATASAAGSFSYTPGAGTELSAGSQLLTATFTPTDSADYTTATANVTLAVTQATPTITWATPSAIPYGTPLSATQLNATASVAGTFTYSPGPGTVPRSVGSLSITATFMPTDSTDYTTATGSVTVRVTQATTSVTWATPAAIVYGTALSATQLNATGSVAGALSYTPAAGTVLAIGAQPLSVAFAPTDRSDYSASSGSVTLTVLPAPSTITFQAPASPMTFGAPPITLSATSSSSLPVVFSVVSGPATISGNVLTITGVGTIVVAADQVASGGYSAAPEVAQSIVVLANPTATTLSSSLSPSYPGQSVIFTGLVNTGGLAPTGSVAFSNGVNNIGTGTMSTVTATNLLANSQGFGGWAPNGWQVSSPVVSQGSTLGPNGISGNVVSLTYPDTLITGYAEFGYWDAADTNFIGKSVTYSVWMRADAPAIIQLVIAGQQGFDNVVTACNLTTTWQRCTATNSVPSTDAQLFYFSMRSLQSAAISAYAWGPQIELASTAGPYVVTTTGSATGNGGLATLTTSALASGTQSITAQFIGDSGNAASTSPILSQIVDAQITVTPASPTIITEGKSTSFTAATAAGGNAPLTLTISPSLPTGLNFSKTGVISGTATASTSLISYTVTATDANGVTGTGSFNLTVAGKINLSTLSAIKTLDQGTAASFTPFTATGGDGTLTFTIASLPAGLSMNSTGTISGTPTASSVAAAFTVTVSDQNEATTTATLTLTVDAPILVTGSTAIITQGKATTFTAAIATGGSDQLSFAATTALPNGLVMSTSGIVTGTATASSVSTPYAVTVTDANSATGSTTLTLTVDPSITATTVIPTTTLTQGHAASSFAPVTASGGDGTLTLAISPTLPAGLTFSTTTGSISGTPSAPMAVTTFSVTATDVNGATGSANFSLAVDGSITLTPSTASKTLTQGAAASFTPVTASGGYGTLSFTATLPAGLAMNSTGLIIGTSTVATDASPFAITVTDLNGATTTATLTITVDSAITATTVVPVTTMTEGYGSPFTPVTASGGDGTPVLAVLPALPAGLSMNSAGLISGTPAATLPLTVFTVTATDLNSAAATSTFSLTVDSALTEATVIASTTMTQGHAVPFAPVTAAGGNAPLVLTVSPALPAGLSMAANGLISGTPNAPLTQNTFTVTATDQDAATATSNFTLAVDSPVIATGVIVSTTLTQSHVTAAFTPVTAAGGNGTLSFTVSPTLPGGLTMNSTGLISGTSTSSLAQTSFTVTVTDLDGATGTASFNLAVDSSIAATTVVANTTMTQGHIYPSFAPVTASGGDGTLVLVVSPGLPAGLSMASSGVISGTASSASSTTTYMVTATDQNGATATSNFSLTVDAAVSATTLVPSTTLIRNLATGSPFSPIAVSGGDGQLTLAISPALPTGLGMSPNGTISGTPTVPLAATTFSITATDLNGASASASFALIVNPVAAQTMIPSISLTMGTAAPPFAPVIGLGGSTPLAYSLSPALPGGLTMKSATGLISGTPTAALVATNYLVTVTDSTLATATAGFTLNVDSVVAETTVVPITTLTQTVPASFTPVTASGGFNPITFGVTPALPAGLSISTTTGTISGTPTAATAGATYHVTAIDANGAAANPTKTFNLTVVAAVTATTAVPSVSLLRDQTAAAFTPVTVTGGFAPLTYTVSPLLPTGLILGVKTGTITGDPSISIGATTYVVTATDSNGGAGSASFTLTVTGSTIVVSTTIPQETLMQSAVATSFIPVTSSGGVGTLKYTISPSLPSGLSLSGTTGAITGTPLVALAASTYAITVTDATQTSGSASFSLTVNPALTATLLSNTNALTENNPSSFTPVAGAGGVAPLAYSLPTALPAGLSLDPATGIISGLPSAIFATTSFTMTVTDARAVKVTKVFSISVATPVTATTTVPTTTLSQGIAKASFTPVTGAGGVGTRTFSVAPVLPGGLTFGATGAITGAATAGSATTMYTVTVTDANQATAIAAFSLTVTPSN